jgi:glutathione S-transferase
MLEETGLNYETVVLPFGKHKTSEYLKINPMGKVPTLVHGDNVITECAAICLYLAEAFPDTKLIAKAGTNEHANALRWLFFAAGPLESAIVNKALGVEVPDEKKGMVGYGNYDDTIAALELVVTGSHYIAGDEFSVADVYVGSQIGWGLQFGSIPALSSFRDYWDRVAQRPAHIKATDLDDTLIAEMKS